MLTTVLGIAGKSGQQSFPALGKSGKRRVRDETILEKYPEGKIQETFQASSAETEGTDVDKTHGGALETADGCSDGPSGASDNTDCADAGVGSSHQEGVYSSQAINAKERAL